MKKRVAIIGAGLCGSVISTLLRNQFQVTVIEQGKSSRPLFNDVISREGEINSSINRAEGLGGTTNYWHNALIELDESDLQKAGINSTTFRKYYDTAWSYFLSDAQKRECDHLLDDTRPTLDVSGSNIAHMVVPYSRSNAWRLANLRNPGDIIEVVYGYAESIDLGERGRSGHVIVSTDDGPIHVDADCFIVCAGGLASPVLLSRSTNSQVEFCAGYHDHPMAYVAKVRLQSASALKSVSCKSAGSADVRSGFVFESNGIKSVFYLRPAVNLDLRSITGEARYILSDLRNDPFSGKKIMRLLSNLDALKEALLFKAKRGFSGDYYSILMLGEQVPSPMRGINVTADQVPTLNWHITKEEEIAYRCSFERFMSRFSSDIVSSNVIPPDRWEFRTAAHHSGCASNFTAAVENSGLPFFAVSDLPGVYLCDASLLRAGGIANSGLTLVALSIQLAELIAGDLQTAA